MSRHYPDCFNYCKISSPESHCSRQQQLQRKFTHSRISTVTDMAVYVARYPYSKVEHFQDVIHHHRYIAPQVHNVIVVLLLTKNKHVRNEPKTPKTKFWQRRREHVRNCEKKDSYWDSIAVEMFLPISRWEDTSPAGTWASDIWL